MSTLVLAISFGIALSQLEGAWRGACHEIDLPPFASAVETLAIEPGRYAKRTELHTDGRCENHAATLEARGELRVVGAREGQVAVTYAIASATLSVTDEATRVALAEAGACPLLACLGLALPASREVRDLLGADADGALTTVAEPVWLVEEGLDFAPPGPGDARRALSRHGDQKILL